MRKTRTRWSPRRLISALLAMSMVLSLAPFAWAARVENCPNGTACADHEAAIGTTHYDTLSEALAAAGSGATVTLLKNVNLSVGSATNIPANVTLEVPADITLTVGMAGLISEADSNLNVAGTLALDSMYAMDASALKGDVVLHPTATLTYGTTAIILAPEGALNPGWLALQSGTVTLNFSQVGTHTTTDGYISLTLDNSSAAKINQEMIPSLRLIGGQSNTPFHITVASGAEMTVSENATLALPVWDGNGSRLVVSDGGDFIVDGTLEVHAGASIEGEITLNNGTVYDFDTNGSRTGVTYLLPSMVTEAAVYARTTQLNVKDMDGYSVAVQEVDAFSYDSIFTEVGATDFRYIYKYIMQTHQVQIQVKTQAGAPISNATVILTGTTNPTRSFELSESGTTGEYIGEVPAGNYTVTVRYAGYHQVNPTSTLTVGGGSSAPYGMDVYMEADTAGTYTVSGKVVGEDSQPIVGAVVTLTNGIGNQVGTIATTTADGAYTVSDVPAGVYTVEVSKTGYQTSTASVTVTAGDETVPDITLTEAATPAPSSPTLSGLTVSVPGSSQNLIGGNFVPTYTSYTVNVPHAYETIVVTPEASEDMEITVNDAPVSSGTAVEIALEVGSNSIRVVVTTGEETTAYTITVIRQDAGGGTDPDNPGPGTGPSNPGGDPSPNPDPDPEPTLPFTDIPADAYYLEAVEYVYELGLCQGTSATTFGPNVATTRAQVVTILYRLAGEPAVTGENPFADATADWYANAVVWASQNGIINGYSATAFGPEDVISREQLTAILYRYASSAGYDVTASGDLSGFSDAGSVSSWATDALAWATGAGLIQGSNNLVDPQGSAIRAQLAVILMRFLENMVV